MKSEDPEARNQALERRIAELELALQEAEAIRRLTLESCDRFTAACDDQLAILRTQRAWKIMLWVRAAYTIAVRQPLLAAPRLAKFGLETLLRGSSRLGEAELWFPSLRSYLPGGMMKPFAAGPAGEPEDNVSAPRRQGPRPQRYDIVILAIVDYDFRFQRPQQLAAQFAREGHRVFWISPTRFLPLSSSRSFDLTPLRENLWEVHLRTDAPDIYQGSLTSEMVAAMEGSLSQLLRDMGSVESCVIVQLPFWRRLGIALRHTLGSVLLYDCMDEWETFPNIGPFNISEEHSLVNECDVLVVTAAKLAEKHRAASARPTLVRNAADFEFFHTPGKLLNDSLASIPRPIVGYFGAIAAWMDLDLIRRVARLRPQYSFVLVGKVFDQDIRTLKKLPNIFFLGHKKYSEMPALLQAFDVCTIPFVVNRVTNATDPVKIYEYFSQGKPVVATQLPELEQCGSMVYIATGADDFALKVDQALAEGPTEKSGERIQFASDNRWSDRTRKIDDAVRQAVPLVSIVIVTYNSAEYIDACLGSLFQRTTYPRYEVVVVDNGSTDGTPDIVQCHLDSADNARLVRLHENIGFAAGNNRAVQETTGQYLVFLNADTIVTQGWVGRLLWHFAMDTSIGILGAVTNFAGNELKLNVGYRNVEEMEDFADHIYRSWWHQNFDLDVIPLFCAMVPRTVWELVGELDEGFGIGMFEDDDFSLRIRKAGFRVAGARDCFIHHFGQGSFRKLGQLEYQRVFDRNRTRFEAKWQRVWTSHKPSPGITPAAEERRIEPELFVQRFRN